MEVEVEALDKRRVDSPATGRQDLLDGPLGAEHHPVFDPDDAPPPVGLDDLRLEQRGPRYPPRLGHGAFGLAPLGLPPVAKMGQQRRGVVLETIGPELMHDALGHGQCAGADLDDHQQLARGVHRRPHPVR
jgi:hypothetical protein